MVRGTQQQLHALSQTKSDLGAAKISFLQKIVAEKAKETFWMEHLDGYFEWNIWNRHIGLSVYRTVVNRHCPQIPPPIQKKWPQIRVLDR